MSTNDRSTTARKTTAAWFVGVAVGLVICLALALAVGLAGNPDAAAGILTGGVGVVVLAGWARWRTVRAFDRTGTAARIAAGRPDERDLRVHQATLAVVGVIAILLSGLASAATFLSVDATVIVRVMPFVLVATMLVSFVVVDRRS
ncbi:MAG TPA: hypothetical protein VHO26_00680 [Propionibacteriaceae bacterium]|nr:hypothetical protein [Propionibacteriaceae bacterium]